MQGGGARHAGARVCLRAVLLCPVADELAAALLIAMLPCCHRVRRPSSVNEWALKKVGGGVLLCSCVMTVADTGSNGVRPQRIAARYRPTPVGQLLTVDARCVLRSAMQVSKVIVGVLSQLHSRSKQRICRVPHPMVSIPPSSWLRVMFSCKSCRETANIVS